MRWWKCSKIDYGDDLHNIKYTENRWGIHTKWVNCMHVNYTSKKLLAKKKKTLQAEVL